MFFSKILNVFFQVLLPKNEAHIYIYKYQKVSKCLFWEQNLPGAKSKPQGSCVNFQWSVVSVPGTGAGFQGIRVGLWWVTGWPLVGHGWASDGSRMGLWWVTGWPLVGHGLASLWPPCKILYFGFIEFVRISTVRI